MNFLRIAWRDISSTFKNKFIRVSVTAIIIVPLLYSLLYLDAFWDPYSKLQNVNVAVVNLDKGAVKDGEQVSYGNDVVDKLKGNKELGWKFVSQKEADRGLKGKGYYAEFVIPADFSDKVLSAKDGKPVQPEIKFISNDKKNFLASQINGKVAIIVKAEVSKGITKEYTKVAFDSLDEVKDGFSKAVDGSKQLSDGINTAKDGAGKLNDGLSQLNSNVPGMTSGVSKLYQGSNALYNGLASAVSGSDQLSAGINQAKGKVKGAIGQFSSDSNIKYLLQPGVLDAAKTIINDGISIKDTDTSMLGLVNSQNVQMAADTANTVNSIVNSEGVKEIISTPSVETLISELDMSKAANAQAIQSRTVAASKLMGDVSVLKTALQNVSGAKITSMLSPFASMLGNSTAMQTVITNGNKLISDAGILNSALTNVDPVKLNNMLAPFAPILQSDTATKAVLANTDNLIKDAGTLNTVLTNVDTTKLNNMLTPLAPILQSDSATQTAIINNANSLIDDSKTLNSTLSGVDTSKVSSLKDPLNAILNNAGSITGLLTNAETMSSQIKVDPADAAQISAMDQTTLDSINQNKDALANLVLYSNDIPDAQKPAIIAAIKMGASVSPAMKSLIGMQQTLSDPNTQALLSTVNSTLSADNVKNIQPALNLLPQMDTMKKDLANNIPLLINIQPQLTTDNLNNVKPLLGLAPQMGAMKQDLSGSMPVLSGVQQSLTEENVDNVKPLLGVASQMGTMKQDLSDNMPVLSGVQQSLTADNVNNIVPLLTLAPKLDSMKDDLSSNADNLQLVSDMVSKVNDPEVRAVIPKLQQLQQEVAVAKPLIEKLNTPDMMNKLAQSPALVNQLLSMQKDLQNNEKILEVTKSELSDNNVQTAKSLINSIPQLTDGINQLSAGSSQLSSGMKQLYSGSGQLKGGLGTLNSSIPALASGVTQLSSGSKDLYTGMNKLSTGATELKDKLKDGSDKINKNLVNSSDDMAAFISEPLRLVEAPINAIKNYGTGFTPYFIPLSLWVGAIMMFFVITDKVDDDIKASPASLVAGKFLSYGYIGIAQSALVSIVVLALGLKPHNILLFFVFNIFMSYVFIAIIQSLIFLLGDAGRLLSIVLLILQLTSDAGTFPLEVVPKFFKIINPVMPFTYCVEALREVITATNYGVFFKDMGILAGYMFVFLSISMLMKGHADKAQRIIQEKKMEAASAN